MSESTKEETLTTQTGKMITSSSEIKSESTAPHERSRFLECRQKEADVIGSGCLRKQRFELDRPRDFPTTRIETVQSRSSSSLGNSARTCLGISQFSKPMDWELRRRRHQEMLRELDEDEHRTRILPKADPLHSWSRENEFVSQFDEKDLRYLTTEGRKTIIRHTHCNTLTPKELPYKAKRNSKYGKWLESL